VIPNQKVTLQKSSQNNETKTLIQDETFTDTKAKAVIA
jgi:hypothetical protein